MDAVVRRRRQQRRVGLTNRLGVVLDGLAILLGLVSLVSLLFGFHSRSAKRGKPSLVCGRDTKREDRWRTAWKGKESQGGISDS